MAGVLRHWKPRNINISLRIRGLAIRRHRNHRLFHCFLYLAATLCSYRLYLWNVLGWLRLCVFILGHRPLLTNEALCFVRQKNAAFNMMVFFLTMFELICRKSNLKPQYLKTWTRFHWSTTSGGLSKRSMNSTLGASSDIVSIRKFADTAGELTHAITSPVFSVVAQQTT